MKEILERFGLSEVLSYLCPGALLLGSSLLWVRLPAGKWEGWQEFLLASFLVVLAYTLGLIVSIWSSEGGAQYINQSRTPGRRRTLRAFLLWSFHWLPDLLSPFNRSIVDAQTAIQQDLAERSGLTTGLTRLTRTPWGLLALARTALADSVGKKGKAVLAEADAVQRRFLFALGVALASLLIGLQALARLGNALLCAVGWVLPRGWTYDLPEIHPLLLLVLVVSGVAASILLRWVAGRWWESQLALTSILLQAQAGAQEGSDEEEPADAVGED
jgi:hypothetical protein